MIINIANMWAILSKTFNKPIFPVMLRKQEILKNQDKMCLLDNDNFENNNDKNHELPKPPRNFLERSFMWCVSASDSWVQNLYYKINESYTTVFSKRIAK